MLVILISWIIIFLILYTFGDLTILLYNKLTRSDTNYNFLDTSLVGLCSVLIPLSINSLWLPTNHYTLLALIVASVIYSFLNYKRLKVRLVTAFKYLFIELDRITLLFLLVSILIFCFSMVWSTAGYDQLYYHYPNILWNNEFSVVPGLANLEDRFGFNSNYLLFAALFSSYDVWGGIIFPIQGLLFILIYCWIILEIVKSGYQWSRLLLFLIIPLYIVNQLYFTDSDTDIIPVLCTFYILVKIVVHPKWYTDLILLSCLLPITLVTFKLSTFTYCLLSLYVSIYLLINRERRKFYFVLVFQALILFLWIIRNVYITGYLAYPVAQIDLFNFDWKIPKATVILQTVYVGEWAKVVFYKYVGAIDFNFTSDLVLTNRLRIFFFYCFFGLALISPLSIVVSLIRKAKISREVYMFYLLAVLSILFWLFSAPDPRFVYGAIGGSVFISLYLLIVSFKRNALNCSLRRMKINKVVYILGSVFFIFFTYKKSHESLDLYQHYHPDNSKTEILEAIIFAPTENTVFKQAVQGFRNRKDNFEVANRRCEGNESINSIFFKSLPDTLGLPYVEFCGGKIQDLRTIEFRGNSINEGFRTKEEYVYLLDENTELYIEEYRKCLKQRVSE